MALCFVIRDLLLAGGLRKGVLCHVMGARGLVGYLPTLSCVCIQVGADDVRFGGWAPAGKEVTKEKDRWMGMF